MHPFRLFLDFFRGEDVRNVIFVQIQLIKNSKDYLKLIFLSLARIFILSHFLSFQKCGNIIFREICFAIFRFLVENIVKISYFYSQPIFLYNFSSQQLHALLFTHKQEHIAKNVRLYVPPKLLLLFFFSLIYLLMRNAFVNSHTFIYRKCLIFIDFAWKGG